MLVRGHMHVLARISWSPGSVGRLLVIPGSSTRICCIGGFHETQCLRLEVLGGPKSAPPPDLGGPEAGPVGTEDDESLQRLLPDFRNSSCLLRTGGLEFRLHQGGINLAQAALMLAAQGALRHAQARLRLLTQRS